MYIHTLTLIYFVTSAVEEKKQGLWETQNTEILAEKVQDEI